VQESRDLKCPTFISFFLTTINSSLFPSTNSFTTEETVAFWDTSQLITQSPTLTEPMFFCEPSDIKTIVSSEKHDLPYASTTVERKKMTEIIVISPPSEGRIVEQLTFFSSFHPPHFIGFLENL